MKARLAICSVITIGVIAVQTECTPAERQAAVQSAVTIDQAACLVANQWAPPADVQLICGLTGLGLDIIGQLLHQFQTQTLAGYPPCAKDFTCRAKPVWLDAGSDAR
jgi:hypothetical protein